MRLFQKNEIEHQGVNGTLETNDNVLKNNVDDLDTLQLDQRQNGLPNNTAFPNNDFPHQPPQDDEISVASMISINSANLEKGRSFSKGKSSALTNRKMYLSLFVFFLVVITISITIPVLDNSGNMTKNSNEEGQNFDSSEEHDNDGGKNDAEPKAEETACKYQSLMASLNGEIYHDQSFEDKLESSDSLTFSAQSQAYYWLLSLDERDLDLCDTLNVIQLYIIAVMYYSTNGDMWPIQMNFLNTNRVCEWVALDDFDTLMGIFCNEVGVVNYIRIPSNNVTGMLPSELGKLTKLERINLIDNQLSGVIPSEIFTLSNLVDLSLRNNNITGTIPPEITNLYHLNTIDLGGNLLTGEIPDQVENLFNLKVLQLDSNLLEGTIPEGIGMLIKLEVFDLYDNYLTGTLPIELGSLRETVKFAVDNNELTGEIPTELGKVSTLEQLYMSSNKFSGNIPIEFGNLKNLLRMSMSNNNLEGQLPSELGQLSELNSLVMYQNNLSGSIPSSFLNLENLDNLDLTFGNNISGDFSFMCDIINITIWNKCIDVVELPFECECCECWEPTYTASETTLNAPQTPSTAVVPPVKDKCETQDSREETLFDIIGIEANQQISDPSSPQQEAFDWLTTLEEELDLCDRQGVVEKYVVTLLFFSTGGTDWLTKYNFLLNEDVCTWNDKSANSGVFCDESGRVLSIRLESNNLDGMLPPEIGKLNSLEFLDLAGNKLRGPIPSELGELVALKTFYLYDNELTGSIPTEIGLLESVEDLELSVNKLYQKIPTELGRLSNLSWLSLFSNKLSGIIPTELSNLDSLTHIQLGDNNLDGPIPSELGKLSGLELLSLYQNNLFGTVPYEYTNLENLNDFDVTYGNNLFGDYSFLCEIDNATIWYLCHKEDITFQCPCCKCWVITNITEPSCDSGVSEYYSLIVLLNDEFNYDANSDPNPLSPHQKAYKWLTSLDEDQLQLCNTYGVVEKFVLALLYYSTGGEEYWSSQMNFLESDDICSWNSPNVNSSWSGVLCDVKDDQAFVTEINIMYNELSGSLPTELGKLEKLESLRLSGNNITGHIPTDLSRMSQMKVLLIDYNSLSGSIPSELAWLPRLHILDLHGNTLTGPIPSAFGDMREMVQLYLGENMLTGTIPSQLGKLSQLNTVIMSSNMLTGSLPSEIGSMTNAQWIEFSDNSLTGSIPTDIRKLVHLTDLYLFINNFTFFIPTEIGFLDNLVSLQLQLNQFSGAIPSELGNLKNLEILSLYSNDLSGKVPESLVNLGNLMHLDIMVGNDIAVMGDVTESSFCEISNLTFWLACSHLELLETSCDCCDCWRNNSGVFGEY